MARPGVQPDRHADPHDGFEDGAWHLPSGHRVGTPHYCRLTMSHPPRKPPGAHLRKHPRVPGGDLEHAGSAFSVRIPQPCACRRLACRPARTPPSSGVAIGHSTRAERLVPLGKDRQVFAEVLSFRAWCAHSLRTRRRSPGRRWYSGERGPSWTGEPSLSSGWPETTRSSPYRPLATSRSPGTRWRAALSASGWRVGATQVGLSWG